MKTLVVSSSFDDQSRSEELARRCVAQLSTQSEVRLLRLKDYPLTGKDLHHPEQSETYRLLHAWVLEADGLVLASPVYNWGCCAELKRFVEVVGTTPSDGSSRGAFFDKVITFVNAAGLPHSYMAFTTLASAMMLDFKCIVSPYQVYVTGRDWEEGDLSRAANDRLVKSMTVFLELTGLLQARTYRSSWDL